MSNLTISGESGTYTITREQLMQLGRREYRELEAALVHASQRDDLIVTVDVDPVTRATTVTWRTK